MASKGQKFKSYAKELKIEVSMKRLNGQSLNSLSREYGIHKSMVGRWAKEYLECGADAFVDGRKVNKTGTMRGRPKVKFSSVQEENQYLRLENEYLKKRISMERKCMISELNLWSSKNLR